MRDCPSIPVVHHVLLARWLIAAVAATLTCFGCASSSSSDAAKSDTFRPEVERVRGMLLKDENGLEVRQLVVADDAHVFASAMSPWVSQTQQAVDAVTFQRMQRNGFRLTRVPVSELDELIYNLGGATMDVSSWHGQVVAWRDLHTLPLGEGGRTMAVDGRVRRYQGGDLRLMARSWVVPMEYGPRVQLEMVPVHRRSESQYHRLLGQSRVEAQPILSLASTLMLEPGYAYILTCECPQMQWACEEQSPSDDVPRAQPVATGQSAAILGPEIQTPTTLGQCMLTSQGGRPSRGMLVFTARIAPELFPPSEPLAVGPAEERQQ